MVSEVLGSVVFSALGQERQDALQDGSVVGEQGSDPAAPRKPTLQTEALPKYRLDSALSAQICSLSENNAEFCLVTATGSIQASFSPAIAPAMSSVRESARAPLPLKPWRPGKLAAMLA
jgi:hypothetical protein